MKRLLLVVAGVLGCAAAGCTSCADPNAAEKPFPCAPDEFDGGQCPSGWRCGLAGRCFNPDAGADLACTDAEKHCAGGWNCGRGVDGGPGVCHPAGVGGEYRCAVETEAQDCEDPAWRCDPVTSTCVPVVENLLQSTIAGAQGEPLTPSLGTGLPAHVAVGRVVPVRHPRTGNLVRMRTVAFASDGGLVAVLMAEEPEFLRDGGMAWSLVRRFDLDEAQVSSITALDTRVAVVFDGGLLQVFDAFDGTTKAAGAAVSSVVPIDPDPGSLEVSPTGASGVAFGQTWLRLMLVVDGGGIDIQSPDGGAFRELRDVTGSEGMLFALDADRLYQINATAAVKDSAQPRDRQMKELGPVDAGTVRRLYGVANDTFNPFLVAEVVGPSGTPSWGLLSSAGCAGGPCYVLTRGPCPVCPSGSAPLQVTVEDAYPSQSGDEAIVARCPATGGGVAPVQRTWRVKLGMPGSCEPTVVGQEPSSFSGVDEDEAPFAFEFTPMHATGTFRAHGAARGRVWWAEDLDGVTNPATPLHPLLLDRTPMLVTRFTQQIGGQRVTRIYAATAEHHFNQSELGFTSELFPADPRKFAIVGTTQGRPGLIIGRDRVINLNAFSLGSGEPQVLARLDPSLQELAAPAVGAIVQVGSPPRSVLVVTSRDTVYSADVTDQLQVRQPDGGGVDGTAYPSATLTQRLVPAPGVPIRDLAVGRRLRVEPGAETPLGSLFVLARDQVFEVDIFGSRWTVTPIPLSPEFGEPLELWTEFNTHGRLAYASGQISALPVPIALGQKLPGGERAVDFARMCGETFAIVDGGVKHYRTDAGWEDVSGVELSAAEQAGSRFFETGVSLFLGTPQGRVFEVTAAKDDGGLPRCP